MTVGIVLAGGYGTRMRPLTDQAPKHLLPVGADPLIVHQLRRLAGAGVTDVVLATGYCAEQFEPALGDGSRWGVRLSYAPETEPLGTGGALRHAWASSSRARQARAVVVLNGDLLSGHDLRAQITAYERRAEEGTALLLHVRSVPDPRAYGSVVCARDGRVVDFVEKPEHPVADLINAGTYVVAGATVGAIDADGPVSWERDVVPGLVGDGAVHAYAEQAYFRDVGSPAALVAASADAVLGRLPGGSPGRRAWVDPAATVEVGAMLTDGTTVHAGARVESGAQVSGSIVMRGAVVQAGARMVDAVAAPDAVVRTGADVTGMVVGAVSEP
ncbi:sugar phosphate nucleotidyltransferase [Luteipulveratus halotolerans]|uniref:sugar phosphate nucleotidyltransferase n=1 Tax=Luteipulveratus halotolerans TaxID=1631356 RepID=UPI0008FBE361|nr:sugar phosphate nucleotidyltransferase [Luteipulveratus halotolerans]